jgi:dipeptidyl aminopeptidase/acylaminoacyl peptidase
MVSDCREGGCETSLGVFQLEQQTALLLHPYSPVGRGGQPPAAVWSPDGRWLAFAAWAEDPQDAGLWVIGASGEGEQALATGVLRGDPTPLWSPDGQWLVFSEMSGEVGEPSFWMAAAGRWDRVRLELPAGARLVAWVG